MAEDDASITRFLIGIVEERPSASFKSVTYKTLLEKFEEMPERVFNFMIFPFFGDNDHNFNFTVFIGLPKGVVFRGHRIGLDLTKFNVCVVSRM
ncbi:hypothetical protein [Gelidibacter salicanalis]|uniref:hypothetical protein n=1 Tax=Gelidibacter salicanalis TaxID=291193 RepID=UPI0018F44073|nr:hypothetical protein [Gelidibacter salicanalis]